MKQREGGWHSVWNNVPSIDYVYRGYGFKSAMWCFRRLLENEKRGSILDVGCGAGFYFRFFRGLGFGQLRGLEYDEGNVRKARDLNEDTTGLEIRQGDIRDLPYPFQDDCFDVVVCLGLVEHFAYPVGVIRKLLKTVTSDGVLLLEMPNFRNWIYYFHNLKHKDELPFHLWWGVREWRRVLTRLSGCRLEQVQTGHLWAYRPYLPRLLGKIHPRLVDFEIDIENRLFSKSGSLAFYKLRKL